MRSSVQTTMHLRRNGVKDAPLIIDIGEAFTKCGVAGDSLPRAVFRTDFSLASASPTLPTVNDDTTLPTLQQHTRSQEEWVAALTVHFKLLYFTHLSLPPKDRPVIIAENPYWPHVMKASIAIALFMLGVQQVYFMEASALPLYLTGEESGLVVEVGQHEARVVPIASGYSVQNAMRACAVGMSSVLAKCLELSPELAGAGRSAVQLEDVACRACHVRAKGSDGEAKDGTVEVGGEAVVVAGKARSHAADALFGEGPDGEDLAFAVLDSLLACGIDSRPEIIANMVICGGTAKLPGFRQRLLEELNAGLEHPRFHALKGLANKWAVASTPFPEENFVFTAVSMLGTMELDFEQFLTPEDFFDKSAPTWSVKCGKDPAPRVYAANPIPDWTEEGEDEEEQEEDHEEAGFMSF